MARAGRRAHARSMHIGARGGRSGSRCPGVERLERDGTGRGTDPERHRGFGLPDRGVRRHQRGPGLRRGGGRVPSDPGRHGRLRRSRDVGHRDDRRRHVERGDGFGGRRSRRSGRQPVRHRERHQVGDRRAGDADGRGRRALARRPGLRLPPGELRLRHQRSDDPPAARHVLRHPGLVQRRHGGANVDASTPRLGAGRGPGAGRPRSCSRR